MVLRLDENQLCSASILGNQAAGAAGQKLEKKSVYIYIYFYII
jgi:hypothetical protein